MKSKPIKKLKNLKDVVEYIDSKYKTDQKETQQIKRPKDWKPKTHRYGELVSFIPQERKRIYAERIITKPELKLDALKYKKESTDIKHKRKVLALITLLHHMRSSDFNLATEVSIPVKRKRFQKIFGSIADVSRVIKDACDLGILSKYDLYYEWIGNTTINPDLVHPCAKTYLIHPENEYHFREYCKSNNILPWTAKENKTNKTLAELSKTFYPSEDFEIDTSIAINQRTHIKRKPGESKSQTEFRIKQQLLLIYPVLRELQKNIEIINKYNNDSDLELTAEPNFTWNKDETVITKIGIRAYCPACSLPKHFNPNIEYTHGLPFLDRPDMLAKKGLTGSEHDVKSSVPRISNFLHTGRYLPFKIDCYTEIMRLARQNSGSLLKKESWNEEIRKLTKKLFMHLNFSSSWEMANHTANFVSEYSTDDKSEKIKQNILYNYDKAIEQFTGNRCKSSVVFLIESYICTAVAAHLVKNGYKVFLCYDGIYTDKPLSSKKFEKLVTHYAYVFKCNNIQLFNNITNIKYNNYVNNNNNKSVIQNVNSSYRFYRLWYRKNDDDRYVRKKE